jgi:hypothetical protein
VLGVDGVQAAAVQPSAKSGTNQAAHVDAAASTGNTVADRLAVQCMMPIL